MADKTVSGMNGGTGEGNAATKSNETLDKLKERFERYQKHYEGFYKEMKDADDAYRRDFKITKPKEVKAVIPPTARNKVQTAVTEMVTDSPKVRRRRSDHDSEAQKKRDDDIEAGLQAFLLDCEDYLRTPLLHELGNFQMRRGMALPYGPLYNKREKRIFYDHLDPRTVYFEPGQWPREVFIHLAMPSSEMEQMGERYPKLRSYDPGDRDETEEVVLIQWYKAPPLPKYDEDDEEGAIKPKLVSGRYAAWIKDEGSFLCSPEPSGYPYLPVDPIASGWGIRALGSKAEDTYQSLIHDGVRALLVNEAEMYTLLTASAGYETWGRYYTEEGQVVPDGFKIEFAPGSITDKVPAGGLHPFVSQPLSPTVGEHFARVYQMIQEGTFSSIIAGQAQPGQRTATANAILTGNNRKKFMLPMRMLQAGVSRMLFRVGMLMEFISEAKGSTQTFTFRGNKLDHTMFGGDYSVEVDLTAPDAQEEARKVAEGKTLVGVLDERTLLEDFFNQENATKVMLAKMFDKLKNSDAFLSSVMDEYLKQIGAPPVAPVAPTGAPATTVQSPGTTAGGFPQGPNGQDGQDEMAALAEGYRAAKTGQAPDNSPLNMAVTAADQARRLQ